MTLKSLFTLFRCLLFAVGAEAQSRSGRRTLATYPADIQSGEAELQVSRSQLVHRVAIAPNGVVAVEFPADDAVVSEHPGNRDLVSLDGTQENETPTSGRRPTDPLIFRPGPGFSVAAPGKPLTLYGVQFGSGLYVTFLFYPVADLSRNAHRLVLKYGLDEIAAARQKIGLRTNLIADLKPRIWKEAQEMRRAESATSKVATNKKFISTDTHEENDSDSKTQTAPSADITAKSPTSKVTANTPEENDSDSKTQTAPSVDITAKSPTSKATANAPEENDSDSKTQTVPSGDTEARLVREGEKDILNGARRNPSSEKSATERLRKLAEDRINRLRQTSDKLPFGKPRYGLSLTVAENADLDDEFRIVVIAVKNRLATPLRLTPGQPDLFIETVQKGRPVLSERLTPFVSVSSPTENQFLPPEEIRWFALVYPAPILGVSQTNAADAPASAEITVKGR